MKTNKKKIIPYLVVIIISLLVVSASSKITTFYLDKTSLSFGKTKENSTNEREILLKQFNFLIDKKNTNLDEDIKNELKTRVEMAYISARKIYKKYKSKRSKRKIKEQILDVLSYHNNGMKNHIFITDFTGNNILSRSSLLKQKNISGYEDTDGRSIILEEIQKVRRRGEGFVRSNFYVGAGEQITLVKNLDMYDWYLGSSINIAKKKETVTSTLLKLLQSIPVDDKKIILLAKEMRELETVVAKDIKFIIDTSASIVILVIVLLALLSRKINF